MQNKKLVMIPGPTPVVRSIQNELGRETVAFGDPSFVADHKILTDQLKEMLGCSGEAFIISGTGTLAMEAAVANSVKAGDSILILSNGFFGDRFISLCRRKGLDVDIIQAEWGRAVTPAQLAEKLAKKHYAAVTVTHVDTSTGVCAPVAELAKVVSQYPDTLMILDGVCATGAEPEDMDKMGLDIVLTGSQKAFGVPPGMAMIWAGPRALQRRESLGEIPEYYCDFQLWLPVIHNPAKYFATPAVNMVWALKEGVRIMLEEGLENRYARHKKNALAMQSALEALGFTILAHEECRAVTLSNLIYPAGIDDAAFRSVLAEEGVMVAGGLGPYAGKMFRLGHMGNIDTHDMVSAIAAIERAMYLVGYPLKLGSGVGALMEKLLG
jgi:aspartate aminotransferase-like enzyme